MEQGPDTEGRHKRDGTTDNVSDHRTMPWCRAEVGPLRSGDREGHQDHYEGEGDPQTLGQKKNRDQGHQATDHEGDEGRGCRMPRVDQVILVDVQLGREVSAERVVVGEFLCDVARSLRVDPLRLVEPSKFCEFVFG